MNLNWLRILFYYFSAVVGEHTEQAANTEHSAVVWCLIVIVERRVHIATQWALDPKMLFNDF